MIDIPKIDESILKEKEYKLVNFRRYNTYFTYLIKILNEGWGQNYCFEHELKPLNKEYDEEYGNNPLESFDADVNKYLDFLSDIIPIFKDVVENSDRGLSRVRIQRELYDFLENDFGRWTNDTWWEYPKLEKILPAKTITRLEEVLLGNESNLLFLQETAYWYTPHDNFFVLAENYFKGKSDITKDKSDIALRDRYSKLAEKEYAFQEKCNHRAFDNRGSSSSMPFEIWYEEAKDELRKDKFPWKSVHQEPLSAEKTSIVHSITKYFKKLAT